MFFLGSPVRGGILSGEMISRTFFLEKCVAPQREGVLACIGFVL
jgi:hypothetical protein